MLYFYHYGHQVRAEIAKGAPKIRWWAVIAWVHHL